MATAVQTEIAWAVAGARAMNALLGEPEAIEAFRWKKEGEEGACEHRKPTDSVVLQFRDVGEYIMCCQCLHTSIRCFAQEYLLGENASVYTKKAATKDVAGVVRAHTRFNLVPPTDITEISETTVIYVTEALEKLGVDIESLDGDSFTLGGESDTVFCEFSDKLLAVLRAIDAKEGKPAFMSFCVPDMLQAAIDLLE